TRADRRAPTFATLLSAHPDRSGMFGGGGMNPRKMKQMMKQMGIDVTELDAEEVVIKTGDEELVFSDAQVTRMDAQGQETYQIVGEPETRELGAGDDGGDESVESAEAADAIPADDVAIVAQRAGVPEDEAREALEAEDGDLAAAIARLE
ncbi:nascent polypeptide-associated complex protein, partial [Haloferax sp. BAB-2207]